LGEHPRPFGGADVAASYSARQPPPFAAISGGEPVVRAQRPGGKIAFIGSDGLAPRDLDKLIADPTQALDVFDFEPVMKKNCRRRISAKWPPASMTK
jgi:hypothetical protein